MGHDGVQMGLPVHSLFSSHRLKNASEKENQRAVFPEKIPAASVSEKTALQRQHEKELQGQGRITANKGSDHTKRSLVSHQKKLNKPEESQKDMPERTRNKREKETIPGDISKGPRKKSTEQGWSCFLNG